MTALDDRVRHDAIERARAASSDVGLLLDAAELIITSGLGSRRMVHRKLRVGWDKAGLVMDALEEAGIVGEDVGDPRDVLVLPDELEDALDRLAGHAPLLVARWATGDPEAGAEAGERAGDDAGDDPGDPAGDDAGDDDAPAPAGDAHPGVSLQKRQVDDVARPGAQGAQGEPGRPRQVIVGRVVEGGAQLITSARAGLARDTFGARTTRRTFRYGYVTGQGVWSWLKRGSRAANHGAAREQIAMARLAGQPLEVERWAKNVDVFRNNRIKRLLRLPKAMLAVGIALLVLIGIVMAAALVVGICAAIVWGGAGWHFWWAFLGWALYVLAALIVWAALTALVLALPVTVAAAHKEGTKVADPPRWAMSLDERASHDAEITPAKVVLALRDCGIPALRNYIKESVDGGAELLSPIAIEGRGMGVTVSLPSGASTEDVQKKRRRLAENCDRHEHELYMTVPRAHQTHFWFANPGALEEPIGPSPLVTEANIKADVKNGGAPIGELLRGDPVKLNLHQKHLLMTGMSNQGKTYCLRAAELWLAFNPRVHFWIADLKGLADWDMFRDLCDEGRFIKGPTDQDAIAATLMVEAAVAEMERRLQIGGDDWDWLVVIVDEAQKAYTNPEKDGSGNPYGGQANNSRYCSAVRRLKNQGRAVNVTIHEGTQDPTNQNLPKLTREASHIRISLAVGTPSQSRMALGDAAVDNGASPHLLRPGLDQGTTVMHGGVEMTPGETSITVRWHFIDNAEAWRIAGRALAKRKGKGAPLVIEGDAPRIDHLENIRQAMRGREKARTVEVLGALIEDFPELYGDDGATPWSHQDLARVIAGYAALGLDIDIRKRDSGQRVLLLTEVEEALRARPEELP